jgi:glyoxylase-like metal-dependent hydrolase (beta-lactamase superfamily II)
LAKAFASVGDRTQKRISFREVERGIYAFTAEGDPNTEVIIGSDAVMIVDTQSTPMMAQLVIDRVKSVTDKPIKYVVLSHHHAVRVLGASADHAEAILASDKCLGMIHERREEDLASEVASFPSLFEPTDSSRTQLADNDLYRLDERRTGRSENALAPARPRPYRG